MRFNCKPFPDLNRALDDFLAVHEKALLQDQLFMNNLFDPSEIDSLRISPKEVLSLLAGEAKKTLLMISPYLQPGMRVLEIGGGAGLVYALLRLQGLDVVSLEPGSAGFGDRHKAGLRLAQILGIDTSGWLKLGIEQFSLSDLPFDLVFSYFVLEHISDLDRTFKVMTESLSPNGVMVHRCPNYTVPFEPHYNIPLIPFKPERTSVFHPDLRQKALWRGLQFTTVGSIALLCKRHGLRPVFRSGMAAESFERVLEDPDFRSRKPGFVKIARILKTSGLLNLLSRLPSVLDTPIEFTARKADLMA